MNELSSKTLSLNALSCSDDSKGVLERTLNNTCTTYHSSPPEAALVIITIYITWKNGQRTLKMDKYRGVCEKGTVPYWQVSEIYIVL